MKRLMLLLLMIFPALVAFSQSADSLQRSPAAATDQVYAGCTVITLDSVVGEVIDASEKAKYHLFPYIANENFEEARFLSKQDGTMILVAALKDGSVRTINYTAADFKNNIYLVKYYSGQIAPANDLNPKTAAVLVEGLLDVLFSQDCKK